MGALDIGIDLGTTKIIIYKEGEGEILREPSVVAVNVRDNSVIAVGDEAYKMLGRTPEYIKAEFPLRGGVISDHILTEILVKECIKRACSSFLLKHRVIICVPSSITDVEKRTLTEVVVNAGGRKVYLIEEPIAAALGAGIDITKANGTMVVDIGGGTTDIAVISLSGVVVSHSVKTAGDYIDEELIKYFAAKYKLSIGKKMATQIKQDIGEVFRPSHDITAAVKGRNLLTGLPQTVMVSQLDIYDCLLPFAELMASNIRWVLERTPPELVGDIFDNGMLLTGGGSLLSGLADYIAEISHVKTIVAENAVECVSVGTCVAFDYINTMQSGFTDVATYKH